VIAGRPQRIDDRDRQDRAEKLGREIGFGGRHPRRDRHGGPFIDPQFDAAFLLQGLRHQRQEVGRDVAVDKQRLAGVADPHPLALGVDQDLDGHLHVGGVIDVDVAIAVVVLDHRHRRLGHDATDQRFAAPGDGDVDRVMHFQKMTDGLAVGRRHQLHGGVGKSARLAGLGHQVDQFAAAVHRFLAAAQDHRIAAFDADRGGVGGHVGTTFVDKEDDPQRHPSFQDL